MVDNALTPHVVVDATVSGVRVPRQYVTDGKIILNIGYAATRDLDLGAEALRFQTRFGGASHDVEIPVMAVLGIYAQETGQGMIFTEEGSAAAPEAPPDEPAKSRPELKIIK